MTELSLIIPAYNEVAAIQAGKLARVATWLATQALDAELIVIDDGSQDATADLAQTVADRVIRIAHAGKAAAIVAGIQAAGGQVILFTDMDQATPITEAPKLLGVIDQRTEIAIGSRGLVREGAPFGRYLLSWGQVALRNLLIGVKIADTQCGFKAMTRAAAIEIIDHLQLYDPLRLGTIQGPSVTSGFDVEFLFVAQRLGYRIQEIPVLWRYQETRRVNLINDAWRGIRDLLNILVADLQGKYPRLSSPSARPDNPSIS
ncbi:glycosyltransferase family 2 protein [soil metagenome]